MNFQKIKNTMEEIRLLGIRGTCYRILYELKNRTGIKEYLEPIDKDAVDKWRKNLSRDVCLEEVCLENWIKKTKAFFIDSSLDYRRYLKEIRGLEEDKILKAAQNASKGKIRAFSKNLYNYGYPKRWHLNPMRNCSWPRVHYSKVMKYERECGDIKLVWEVNRFGFVFDYVRAYHLTGDSVWCRAFCRDLKSWEEENPYRQGANWSSGQELAIRVLVWIFALFNFYRDKAFSEEDFKRINALMYLHGEHIYNNIDYALRAVHNNHLIGEALALYAIGTYFPWFKNSRRWKEIGRNLLENECLKQFYPDGGYCQNSHNYHRLALHYYLWGYRIAELNKEPFSSDILQIFWRSFELLCANMNMRNGRLPNYGANDGALLNPWTCCDFSDFRPLLSALNYAVNKNKLFVQGPWEEELLWFFGPDALCSPSKKLILKDKSFEIAGLHILRQSGDNFLAFRCGTIRDRFGQADQLHLDVWWKGLNIAQDPGSYLYNDKTWFYEYFVSTAAHNTVTVNDRSQMLLYRRFKFLYWTKAKLLSFDVDKAGKKEVAGEHYGYEKKEGVVHRRKVKVVSNDLFLVTDEIYGKERVLKEHKLTLNWLILDFEYEEIIFNEWKGIKLKTSKGDFYILISAVNKEAKNLSFDLEIIRGKDDRDPRGWISRYYACKEQSLCLSAIIYQKKAKFFTILGSKDAVGDFLRSKEIPL
ncbi:heparinase II/III family protein [Peptococcaceae bacterium]|nr:heparinase II/III family protein [Peptococcaceae bacterium]